MRVAWLHDDPGYIGGAELTMQEFREAAPEGVELTELPPGEVVGGYDRYVIGNHWHYLDSDLAAMDGKVTRYHHDVRPMRVKPDQAIFCSPVQRDYMRLEGECVPPPVDLASFKAPRQSKKRREGTCSIAQWRNPGKGGHLVAEWARENGPVDVFGPGPFEPTGTNINYLGPMGVHVVKQKMWEYETFVFLPFDIEPFCRTIAEAHAAGMRVITNGLIGARHYLDNDREALTTAGEDFWRLVLE